jgi:hypothetical protein
MRATHASHRLATWRKATGIVAASMLAMTILGGTVQAADSRDFTVSVSTPTPASQGGATKFDVIVESTDNQTIANVHLSIPAIGSTWPAGITIDTVFGEDASLCSPSNGTSLSCDFGNIAALGTRKISILATVATTVPVGNSITFSASAETNNENGSNRQVETGTSGTLNVTAFNANSLTTANLQGLVSTSTLGSFGAGNLQTSLNLLQNNGGKGNVIAIVEGTSSTQPSYCVTLKLTCQPDFTDVTVNAGAAVSPYLETILTAQVPKTYNVKKAFVIHVDGSTVKPGFPLYNSPDTSCVENPDLVPCADFTVTKDGILTITVHTATNGRMAY